MSRGVPISGGLTCACPTTIAPIFNGDCAPLARVMSCACSAIRLVQLRVQLPYADPEVAGLSQPIFVGFPTLDGED